MKKCLLFACITWLSMTALAEAAECRNERSLAVKSRAQYSDYYGTAVSSSLSLLTAPTQVFRWGIVNPKPVDMAYFAAFVHSGKQKFERFRATLHIDAGIQAPMVFSFLKNDRNGELLEAITLTPGESRLVDFSLAGTQKLFIVTEAKINHGVANRLIIGEPSFYSCRGS